MNKFKVGDKVKIVNTHSDTYRGKIATITKSANYECYDIDIDDGVNRWFDSAFELYEEQTKEYNIFDLLSSFSDRTEFESGNIKYKIYKGNLFWNPSGVWSGVGVSLSIKEILEMKFIKAEEPKLKPMTFEEAVRTGNKIKYKYDGYTLDKFRNTQNIFKHLVSPMYGSKTVSDIILEGTWFAEGVYE